MSLVSADFTLLVSHTHLSLFSPWHWNHHLFFFSSHSPLPCQCLEYFFPVSSSGSSPPPFVLWMFCSAEMEGEEGEEEERGEVLPLLVRQQLGNSSGSNKGSTTLLWLMPVHTHQTITGLFSTCIRSLGSVTMRAAKHTNVPWRPHRGENTPFQWKQDTYSRNDTNNKAHYSNYRQRFLLSSED